MSHEGTGRPANRLAQETSPYLLQHAQNPVDWYPWGEEALRRARELRKPILLSIGYSACHWCHVMERESFEDERIAALMNEHFGCIKVDREERPARAINGAENPRCDGGRRLVRPDRRWFLAVLDGRTLAGPSLREDALRQCAAGPDLSGSLPGHGRVHLPAGGHRDARLYSSRNDRPGGRLLLRHR